MDDDLKEFTEIVREYYDSGCNSAFAGGAKGKDATRSLVTKFMTDSSAAIKVNSLIPMNIVWPGSICGNSLT